MGITCSGQFPVIVALRLVFPPKERHFPRKRQGLQFADKPSFLHHHETARMDHVHEVILLAHVDDAISFFQHELLCRRHEEQEVHQRHASTLKQPLDHRKQRTEKGQMIGTTFKVHNDSNDLKKG